MFVDFFYKLRDTGIPVSPTAFLTLQRALAKGMVCSLEEFYTASRSILVKSERYFDLFDRVFAHHFEGAEMPDPQGLELDALARSLLEHWLKHPEELSRVLGVDERALQSSPPSSCSNISRSVSRSRRGSITAGASGSERAVTRRSGIPGTTPGACAWAGCRATSPP